MAFLRYFFQEIRRHNQKLSGVQRSQQIGGRHEERSFYSHYFDADSFPINEQSISIW